MLRTPDLTGRALDGRYELHAAIGEGAFGRVYVGLDRRLARSVAVKVIKPWWAEDSAWVERFEREAQLLARVSDPGIVQIFDIGHAEEGPYYVAELIDGESLATRLERGPIEPEEARAIAEQLAHALGSAHAQGVVHCDVKPANVMLTNSGQVKVADFGVARLAEGTSQALSATVAGTPRYMSPEQARGGATSPTTDVYSAAVVLYEMLAGRPPFEHGSPVELGLRHIQDRPEPLPATVPPALREIVARALAKNPAERYADGSAMAAALAAADVSQLAVPRAPVERRVPRARAQDGMAETTVLADTPTLDLAAVRAAQAAHTSVIGKPPRTPGARRVAAPAGGNPHLRRRIVLTATLLLLACVAALLLLNGSAPKTTVPELRGLPVGGVSARARRTHVNPRFARRHSNSPAGIAIAQSPAPGARVSSGSSVEVVVSSGPPPVSVPGVVGRPSSAAESVIADAGLRYSLSSVSAPGTATGQVVHQSPGGAASVPRGSTIALSVAEAPQWRALTTFAGDEDDSSVPFRIRGRKWRITYDMSYQGTCLLIITCFGPSAQARNLDGNSTFGGFELSEGSSHTHVFEGGPGLYSVEVSAGHDAARWSVTVEDYY